MSQIETVERSVPFWYDWKFIVTTLLALAGVLVPVWLWQSDQSAQSLQAKVVSTVPMKINSLAAAEDIQVVIGGVPIPSPYLSTVELINNGRKPIAASDFYSPLVISVVHDSQLVRAIVTSTSPVGIDAKLTSTKNSTSLNPLLLNSGDVVRIAVITSNKKPDFSFNARIAGIKQIEIDDITQQHSKWKPILLFGLMSIASILLYMFLMLVVSKGRGLYLNRWATLLVALLLGFSGAMSLNRLFSILGVDRNVWGPVILSAVFVVAFITIFFIRRLRAIVLRR